MKAEFALETMAIGNTLLGQNQHYIKTKGDLNKGHYKVVLKAVSISTRKKESCSV